MALVELVGLAVFFGVMRAIIEVDLIEDLWKNAFRTEQTIGNFFLDWMNAPLKERFHTYDFDWEFYQYIHAFFAFGVFFISALFTNPIFNAVIISIGLVFLYGVVLDFGYFLIRMYLTKSKWSDEIDYMRIWIEQAPIKGFTKVGNIEFPVWYMTSLLIFGTFMSIYLIFL